MKKYILVFAIILQICSSPTVIGQIIRPEFSVNPDYQDLESFSPGEYVEFSFIACCHTFDSYQTYAVSYDEIAIGSSWISEIENEVFSLNYTGDEVEITVSGTIPLNFVHDTYSIIFDVTNVNDESKFRFTTVNYKVESVGIEDWIEITDGDYYFSESDDLEYHTVFIDYDPDPLDPDYITEWNLLVTLFSSDGEFTYIDEDKYCCTTYADWYLTAPFLPENYSFLRNDLGQIKGSLRITGKDNDGIEHHLMLEVGINKEPDKPIIYPQQFDGSSLKLVFSSNGATNYNVYYDTDPYPPYNGTGLIQGDSPINVGNLTQLQLDGLQSCTPYYFVVIGENNTGQSEYSDEVNIEVFESSNSLPVNVNLYDLEISNDTEIEGNYYFRGNLIIQSGATVEWGNGFCYMDEDSKIIIEPGAKLILNGATCTGVCNQTWQGIEVWGDPDANQYPDIETGIMAQGHLILKNGAKIENAVTGVLLAATNPNGTIDNTKAGGIIQVPYTGDPDEYDASFINNQTAVNFRPYHQFLPGNGETSELANLSFFKNTLFEVNDDYLMGNDWGDAFIYMLDVYGIDIKGSTFNNNLTAEPSGHGINAYHCHLSVGAMCGNTQISPCPEGSLLISSFTNLTKGVNLISAGTYTLTVNNARFYDNSNGIFLDAVNNATLLFNEFYIGETDEGDEQQCGTNIASYGINISNSIGFTIEENEFSKAQGSPPGNYIGIRLTDCPSESDVIYLNEFDGLSVGIQAEGFNRPPNGGDETGVTYLCNRNTGNSYDFYVADNSTVGGYMGDRNYPSGNTLSAGAVKQFQNDYTEAIIYYYKHEEIDQRLTNYSSYVFTSAVYDPIENDCPSHYGGQPPIDGAFCLSDDEKLLLETEYLQSHTDYNNVETLYDNLLDGGNTQALQADVESAWPQDMWELRAELLGNSPHLSKEVLMVASNKTDVLPESVLFEILSANPDELRKEELMAYLENKEQPLPQYMVDILRQLANGTSYKTVLLSEMAAYHAQKIAAAQAVIRSVVNEDEPDMEELRNWLDNIGGLEADKQIIETYIIEGDYNSAQSLLNLLPTLYGLGGDNLQAYNDYKALKQLLMDLAQQGRSIFELSEGELASVVNLAEYGNGSAKSSAQNLLEFAFGYDYCNCPDLPENIQLKSSAIDMGDMARAKGLEISSEPNPADIWVSFDYTLPLHETQGTIEITDNLGRTIHTVDITQQQGQYVMDTRNYNAGVYYYTLKCGSLQQTGKLIVN